MRERFEQIIQHTFTKTFNYLLALCHAFLFLVHKINYFENIQSVTLRNKLSSDEARMKDTSRMMKDDICRLMRNG